MSTDPDAQFNFRGGHFLREDFGSFDAPFFSIKPAEAIAMDPHQCKLLEVTYRAVENGKSTRYFLGEGSSVPL